jgi:hypothetical protein
MIEVFGLERTEHTHKHAGDRGIVRGDKDRIAAHISFESIFMFIFVSSATDLH